MQLLRLDVAEQRWNEVTIPRQGLALCRGGDGSLLLGPQLRGSTLAVVVRFEENGVERAALVCAPLREPLWVDGYAPLGVQVLEERSEIAVGGELLYFTSASAEVIVAFPDAERPTRCARCRKVLGQGDQALRCPRCRAWHHEGSRAGDPTPSLLCWSHDIRCAGCARLRESLSWKPEEPLDA